MEKKLILEIGQKIAKANRILITSHTNPDGDAIGSCLGLYHYFKNHYAADCKVLIPNKYPVFYDWMPGVEEIVIYSGNKDAGKILINTADLIFILDYNSYGRVEVFEKEMHNSKATKIMIDHHPKPEKYFDYSISDTSVSSTAELIYKFLNGLKNKPGINLQASECIYTGIMTDTGSFSYLCNNPETYLVTSDLIKNGVDGERIHRLVYDTYSEDRLRLLGFSINERLVVINEFNTAYIYLSSDDMKKFKFREGDTEGFVNYPLSIKEVNFAAFFREFADKIRISFRSKADFAVNSFAKNHFKGGGHKNASGGDSYDNLEDTLSKFEALLPQYKNLLIRSIDK